MLVVRKLTGFATIQDEGRPGFAAQGVPRGGALVRALARRANAAVGNPDGAACVEIFGRVAFEAERETVVGSAAGGTTQTPIVVATERGDARVLRAGEEIVVEPDARLRVRYLALGGGVDAPLRLGSRAVLAVAGLGRALRVGDRLAPAGAAGPRRDPPAFDASGAIAIVAGPDDPGAARALARATFRIARASDRTGTRLDGDAIASHASATMPSSPMVCGAIQLPAGGEPVVIGPDGPTTGGYPIVAVVARAALDRFHALPIGAEVSFVLV